MPIQTLIFDFGNVLGCFDHSIASRRLACHTDLTPEEVHARLFGGTLEADYECARLTTAEFIHKAKQECRLRCSDEQFTEDYNDIFWINNETCALVPALSERFRLLLLSNTNELHLQKFRPMFAETLSHFHELLFSHEVGARKPSATIFATAQCRANCDPAQCLFFDDVAVNVEGARAFGWNAVLFRSAADVTGAVGWA